MYSNHRWIPSIQRTGPKCIQSGLIQQFCNSIITNNDIVSELFIHPQTWNTRVRNTSVSVHLIFLQTSFPGAFISIEENDDALQKKSYIFVRLEKGKVSDIKYHIFVHLETGKISDKKVIYDKMYIKIYSFLKSQNFCPYSKI